VIALVENPLSEIENVEVFKVGVDPPPPPPLDGAVEERLSTLLVDEAPQPTKQSKVKDSGISFKLKLELTLVLSFQGSCRLYASKKSSPLIDYRLNQSCA
jgi:hypothetical protein